MMDHRTVKISDLEVGDVICLYGNFHFHYPITKITRYALERTNVTVNGRLVRCMANAEIDVVVSDQV